MRKLVLAVILFASFPVTLAQTRSTSMERATFGAPRGAPKWVAGEVLVRFRPGTTKEARAAAHALPAAAVLHRFASVDGLEQVSLPPGESVAEAIALYLQDPRVLYAQPNYIRYALAAVTPNDPGFINQWDMTKIMAPDAWGIQTGSNTVAVGIIDTGVDYNHADLAGNFGALAAPLTFSLSASVGGGSVTCATGTHGYDPATSNTDCDPLFHSGEDHGTHVAGTIAAVGNNAVGIAGINWQSKLFACRFLVGADGSGSDADAIRCMDYYRALKNSGVTLIVTNNSWGGTGWDTALMDAIKSQGDAGILYVAAAGNDGSDNDVVPHLPSSFPLPNIIAVASTNSSDALSSFSNYGDATVDVAAPGSSIYSTLPSNIYGTMSGTSMATPHVTGGAALVKAQFPAYDWKKVRNLLLTSGDVLTPALDDTVSGKRLNLYNALTCSGRTGQGRKWPPGSGLTAALNQSVSFTYWSANCADPAAPGSAAVSDGSTIAFADDGTGSDFYANDGMFTGSWTATANGTFTVTFPDARTFDIKVLAPYTAQAGTYNWRDITANGINLNLDDETAATVTPGFAFRFGGATFDHLVVGSDGQISLNTSANSPVTAPLPWQVLGGIPDAFIAPWWDDLQPVLGDPLHNVYWGVLGSADNHELVIEYRAVPYYEPTVQPANNITFQVVFSENSNNVLFQYKDTVFGGISAASDHGATATVGMQISATSAVQYSRNSGVLNDGTAILWTAASNPVPAITTVSPTSVVAGSGAFTLTVNGSNFISSSVVRWNGADKTTHFVSSAQLTADIAATDIYTPGTYAITVYNPPPGGGTTSTSGSVSVTGNAVPTITSLDPTSALVGSPDTVLTIIGTGFVAGATVQFGGTTLTPTSITSTAIVVTIPAAQLATGGSVSVTVTNPPPGGGASAAMTFTVGNPVPVLVSLSPSSALRGSAAFTLTLTGTGFISGSTVNFGSTALTPLTVTATEITVTVPAASLTTAGTVNVNVSNPSPGGGTSGNLTFTINNPLPVLTSLDPVYISGGGGAFTLHVHGTSFMSDAVIYWGTQGLTTTYVDSTHLTASVGSSLTATPGTVSVTVVEAAPGGGTSAAQTFTVTGFTVATSGSATATVTAGQSGTYTIEVAHSLGNFDNAVSLSCTSGLPSKAVCAFSPATVTPGATSGTTTLTISTTAATTASNRSAGGAIYALWLPMPLLLVAGGMSRRRWRKKTALLLGLALCLALIVILPGCGGGGGTTPQPIPGTPPGTYTITVQGASGTLNTTTTVTLTVQ